MEEAEFEDSGEAWSTHPDPSDRETLQADAGAACLQPCCRCSAATPGEREWSWESKVLDVSEIYIITT